MKSTLLSLFFVICAFAAQGQIVITEIMYNPPESGTDSLEYIEILNTGNAVVDISGYFFDPAEGVGDTIPAGTMLAVGEHYVFAENAAAMMNLFGVVADQWTDGALTNGGEDLVLRDSNGDIVDFVEYGDVAPWPSVDDGTDGNGASIELCDVASDNSLGSNWRAADNDTGVMINGIAFKGTPGANNTVVCMVEPDHVVAVSSNQFTPADLVINVGETVRWENIGGTHNVNGTQATYPGNPESFGNGAASSSLWTYDYTFNQVGVNDYQCDPHVGLGMVGTVTVVDPNAPQYPAYDIATVTTNDAEGVADSLFVSCALTGTVHSPNFRPDGLTFTIIDDNGDGINVFLNSGNLGYEVSLGDEVTIEGEIGQFNGLTQIVPATITLNGTNTLMDPTLVSTLDESTESQLVTVVGTINEADWLGDGTTFNVDMTLESGEVVVVRVDSDVDPSDVTFLGNCDPLQLTGIGGQFDGDSPYDSGYQLFPRYIDDIDCTLSTNDLEQEGQIDFSPNPANGFISVQTEVQIEKTLITDVLGKVILDQNYSQKIDVSSMVPGVYNLIFIKGNRRHIEKLIIN